MCSQLTPIDYVREELTSSEIQVYECLVSYDWGDGAWPGQGKMGKELNVCRMTVSRAIKKLWKLDVIRKIGSHKKLPSIVWATCDSYDAVVEKGQCYTKNKINK